MKQRIVKQRKIHETKSCFLKKNKINKILPRLTMKKREETQITKIRDESGHVTTDQTK